MTTCSGRGASISESSVRMPERMAMPMVPQPSTARVRWSGAEDDETELADDMMAAEEFDPPTMGRLKVAAGIMAVRRGHTRRQRGEISRQEAQA